MVPAAAASRALYEILQRLTRPPSSPVSPQVPHAAPARSMPTVPSVARHRLLLLLRSMPPALPRGVRALLQNPPLCYPVGPPILFLLRSMPPALSHAISRGVHVPSTASCCLHCLLLAVLSIDAAVSWGV